MSPRSSRPTWLVPVDYTQTSERGIERAVALARELHARLVLLHVTPGIRDYDRFSTGADLEAEGTPAELDSRLRSVAQRHSGKGVDVWTVVLFSPDPGDTIARYAVNLGAEMIVMGTHAREGLDHLFQGSVAESVIRSARCPVITVGPQVRKT